MQIACIQLGVRPGRPEENYRRVAEALRGLPAGVDVAVLPELWNMGYRLEDARDLADPAGEETRTLLARLALEQGLNIVGGSVGILEKGRIFNTSYTVDAAGCVINEYRKIHLFGLMEEDRYLVAGDALRPFQLAGALAATVICYDLRFPEPIRYLAACGCQVLFVPAQWPKPRLEHWRLLLRARAVENQMFVIGVNVASSRRREPFFGSSLIVDPWGEVIQEAGDGEEVLMVELDLDRIAAVRREMPVLKDRRPAIYRKIEEELPG